jgi:hypothetical protein
MTQGLLAGPNCQTFTTEVKDGQLLVNGKPFMPMSQSTPMEDKPAGE